VCMALFAPVAGRFTSRFGFGPVLTLGMVVAGTGCLLLATESYGDGLLGLEWRLALVGIGSGLMSSTMSNAAVSTVAPAYVGMASAVHNTCRQVGATLGVALLGAVLATRQTRSLDDVLPQLPNPAARTAVESAVRSGSTSPANGVPHLSAAMRTAIDTAAGHGFESGLHLAMLVTGLTLFACAVAAAALLGRRR
jgi:hypothetical protein